MEEPLRKSGPERVLLFNCAEVHVFKDMGEASLGAAEEFLRTAKNAVKRRGVFRAALSGGKTPENLYRLLSSDKFRERVDWRKAHVFWGDERCVPPGDRESNFRLASSLLLKKLEVPGKNIHRIRGEDGAVAAEEYEREIKEAFGLKEGGPARFDLFLLGMGRDGHIASLFPGTPALREKSKVAVAVRAKGKPALLRITLTPPVILNSRKIIALAGGREKARALSQALKGTGVPEGPGKIPAAMLRLSRGRVKWFVDEEAASLLAR